MSCIKSKKELKFYIAADCMMNRGTFKESYRDKIKNLIVPDYIMAYLKSMRKVSYYKWLTHTGCVFISQVNKEH